MRPNYCVFATVDGRLAVHGLYYNERKAKRAFRKLRSKGSDGSYTLLLETPHSEISFRSSGEVCVYLRVLGDDIWTERERWKKSFFDTSEEEYQELASSKQIPIEILKEIAGYEKDYIENRSGTRWRAWKRAYLPRLLYYWI